MASQHLRILKAGIPLIPTNNDAPGWAGVFGEGGIGLLLVEAHQCGRPVHPNEQRLRGVRGLNQLRHQYIKSPTTHKPKKLKIDALVAGLAELHLRAFEC